MKDDELLLRLSELQKSAFKETTPNLSILKTIKEELFQIKKKDREKYADFAKELSDKLFKSSTIIPGLDLDNYFDKLKREDKFSKKDTIEVSIKEQKTTITFDELLKKLLICIEETLINLKGYAIVKLSNQDNENYNIKVLYDDNYYFDPIKHKITKVFDECDSISIRNYKDMIEKGDVPETNYICLVLLTSKINDKPSQVETNDNLEFIINSFDNFEYCTIKQFGNYTGDFYKRSVEKQNLLDEINFVTSKFLSNGKISYEEEKVIKKIFETSNALVLNYKLLQAGNSGSKVMEVKPVTSQTTGNYDRRFIIKYSKIDAERKLKKEIKNFTNYLEAYEGNNEYKCTHYETATYEALKYDFAKSPGSLESYSFSEILEDSKNPYYLDSSDIIEELFNLDIFKRWQTESSVKCSCQIEELYSKYVNFKKIREQVLIVKNLEDSEFETSIFNKNLNKLLKHKIEVNKKICHGDLHSENFFKDEKGKIFLIDFGLTGIEHSIIDHTSLECSLKFNHIPNYVKLENLLNLEQELIIDNSFSSSYTFRAPQNRKDLHQYCEIIRQVRVNGSQYLVNQSSKVEYYISLFFMTYRQVRYPDMNQLYALESSEILLNKIIKELGI